MSWKNKLQEYCMRHKLTLPQYFDESYGSPHMLKWRSSVLVSDRRFSCELDATTKVEAQTNVAKVALENLVNYEHHLVLTGHDVVSIESNEIPPLTEVYIHKPPEWNILVDVENIQPHICHGKPIHYYIYVSSFSSIDVSKYKTPVSTVVTIDSGNSDASDYLMAYHAGGLAKTDNIKNYIILSRDRASSTLAQILSMEKFNVMHFKTLDTFDEFINKI